MLIDFTVENFRSFQNEEKFSMVASNKLQDHMEHCVSVEGLSQRLLRAGVIYGANASGKSNLVKAMAFAQQLIRVKSGGALGKLASNQFRFSAVRRPSRFEFRFVARGKIFSYGFSITPEHVEEEWLNRNEPNEKELVVFQRKKQIISIGKNRGLFSGAADASKQTLKALQVLKPRADQLLLNRLLDVDVTSQGELLQPVVWWFAACLTTIQPNTAFGPLVDFLENVDLFRSFASKFLNTLGTGIDELFIDKTSLEAEKLPKDVLAVLQSTRDGESSIAFGDPSVVFQFAPDDPSKVIRRNISARHQIRRDSFLMPFQEESDGTRRCLDFLPALFHIKTQEMVFVVDEINRSLHPLLCHALLKFFLSEQSEINQQQMIATTHETHLLDQELLRRDEVWFVEKDAAQASHIYSLSDMNVRNDVKLEKGYLNGRFGGIPIIGDAKKLQDMIVSSANGKPNGKKKTPH